jgi:hypothetical protein
MVTFCLSNGMATPWKKAEMICGEDGGLTQGSKEASKQFRLRYFLHRLKFKVIKSGNQGSDTSGDINFAKRPFILS